MRSQKSRAKPPVFKMKTLNIKEPIFVDKFTECHVTPNDVADRMVNYLGNHGDKLTLEPQAGTGALADALLRSGHSSCEMVLIERHIKLCNVLHYPGAGIINECFLEWHSKVQNMIEFPRIIMNPPFKKVKAHMKAAKSLLGHNGHEETPVLVALVPSTYETENMETMEHLPNTTFANAKVNTKIIRIYKT